MATKILWIDDEMEALKSQIMFLENKGYEVDVFSNGYDGYEFLKNHPVDVILLDESMPGMSGLETLAKIKEYDIHIPVVMVTKNEAENIMEEAIGSQITDYLIKPVNPNQILLTLKKIIDQKSLVSEKTTQNYQQEFRNLFMALNSNPDYGEWCNLYRKLIYWELEMQKSNSPEMLEIFSSQKDEANNEFCKFVDKNYASWIKGGKSDTPVMSHTLMDHYVFPHLKNGKSTFFILIDNLRWDQWKSILPKFSEYFRMQEEEMFSAILPTSTQYSRNAIFSGLLPMEIEKKYPVEWKNDDEEGGKNLYEEKFFADQLKRKGFQDIRFSYTKVTNHDHGEQLVNSVQNLLHNDLNIIVYNFVDMLSHARTEMEVLKELANDEVSYRSLTMSWFEHSPLFQALKKVADKNIQLVIATDHGSVRVKTPSKVIGDKQTTANIRYKHGKNLNYDSKAVLAWREPHEIGLPKPNFNSSYIFARNDVYLCYPNNFNHYANYFRNTFQHGGVSLEEMLIPVIRMESKT
ncbi:MAG TPA: response regulator [Chitinophagaceae bacterium]|nr:response regulator [Chitinophagaceae bacterium]HNF71098.1 response regulator [Chitinophagaceae bacterium]